MTRQLSNSSKHRSSSLKKDDAKHTMSNIVDTSTEKKSPGKSVLISLDDKANQIKINDQFVELIRQSQQTQNLFNSVKVQNEIKQPVEPPKPSAFEIKQAEDTRKAKNRLEMICKLLGSAWDGMGKQKQQEALSNMFEEIVFAQGNKYDAQSLRLLWDM